MNASRYIAVFFAICLLCVCGHALFIWFVDPYGYNRPHDRSLFPVKPAMPKNQHMAKAQIIKKTNPDTVIIGTSRADYGIDPDHPALALSYSYNAGIKGARIAEQRALAVHAVHSGAKHIIWALDFFAFNDAVKPRPDFTPARLYNETKTNRPATDWQTFVSLSSLKPALQTSLRQNTPHMPDTYTNGQHNGEELDFKLETKGYKKRFADDILLYLTQLYYPYPGRAFDLNEHDFPAAIGFFHQNNVKTTLFINPLHPALLSVIRQTGLMQTYEQWKRHIYESARHSGLTVTDFTFTNGLYQKSLQTTYLWEPSHYKPVIGDFILSHIFDGTAQHQDIPLTSQELSPSFIQTQAADIASYPCKNPDEAAQVKALIIASGLQNRLIPEADCP